MLRIGQTAPDFELPGADPGGVDRHALTDYTSRGWAVVLVFYPVDFHPSCTDQMCSLRDADWLTTVEDAVVLGIGGDSVYAHREYGSAHDINYPLLADSDGAVSQAYGVLAEEFEGHRKVPERALFVVDPDRNVQLTWRASTSEDRPDLDSIRKATNCVDDQCQTDAGEDQSAAFD